MISYVFTYIRPCDVLIFMELIRKFRCLRIVEMYNDTQYNDIYIRIRYNKKFRQYGVEDFFENWDVEYEPE